MRGQPNTRLRRKPHPGNVSQLLLHHLFPLRACGYPFTTIPFFLFHIFPFTQSSYTKEFMKEAFLKRRNNRTHTGNRRQQTHIPISSDNPNRSFTKLPSLHHSGGDGAFSVICSDIILHAGSLHLVYASQRSQFSLCQRPRVISSNLPR